MDIQMASPVNGLVYTSRSRIVRDGDPLAEFREKHDEERRILTFIASDETIDRYNSIIRADGWQVENYMKNPVMLWCHESWGLPIAKGEKVWTDKKSKTLMARGEFPPESEGLDFANMVYKMYQLDMLRAVSVGFKPLKVSEVTEDDAKEAGFEKGYGVIYEEQELFEFSAVPVPGNPNALKKEMDEIAKRCAVALPTIEKIEDLTPRWLQDAMNKIHRSMAGYKFTPSANTLGPSGGGIYRVFTEDTTENELSQRLVAAISPALIKLKTELLTEIDAKLSTRTVVSPVATSSKEPGGAAKAGEAEASSSEPSYAEAVVADPETVEAFKALAGSFESKEKESV